MIALQQHPAQEALPNALAAPIIWITGLSGAGKTTLASAVCDQLARDGVRALLLDGDAVRHALDSRDELARHDLASRVRRAWRLAELARIAALQGMPVVVATISLIHAVQNWSRAGPAPYCEILLAAEVAVLRQRNPGLYGSGDGAHGSNVVGIDIAPEFPQRPELIIEQRFVDRDLTHHATQVVAMWRSLARQTAHRA